ncbi:MAG TPA: glycoside hydrolase family 35 protein [Puia sp.]|nr:glycoside hydrolase family 35 protein [Puia sp.]
MKRRAFVFFSMTLLCLSVQSQSGNHQFSLGDSTFLLDGKPFFMISGEMHYSRVPRECWRARMKMARAMGLNTIGTYVFWNLHEPEKGHYDFSGDNDIAEFVKTAKEEGLWVILRPSPYVCAEWEFGGYPYWLQKEKGLVVRSKNPRYLKAYSNYIRAVGKELAPLQVNHGGNILMVQIENEYGSYSDDKDYLEINKKMFIQAGFDGLLYTCDPKEAIANGHLPGLLPAINGIDKPDQVKRLIRENNNGKGPFYIAEWYPAWFDWWGAPHHKVPADEYVGRLESVLAAGISINMYMFHGGTTRGFMNGANVNDKSPYEPQISSYDYDAPLDEAGNATEKFLKFRDVIARHLPPGEILPPPPIKYAIAVPAITFTTASSLFDVLPSPVKSSHPLTFEDLNQAYGFVLYRTVLDGGKSGLLKIEELRDYGLVFVNGRRVGILDRRLKQDSLVIDLPAGKVRLDILVENLGRVNFGPALLHNQKGITEKVLFNKEELKGWQHFKLPFTTAQVSGSTNTGGPAAIGNTATGSAATGAGSVAAGASAETPVIKRGAFELAAVGDTYLDMSQWGKGMVWINGHNLGRYWAIGPQQTLYVPGEWLKKGSNEITVLELLKPAINEVKGVDHPILDRVQ